MNIDKHLEAAKDNIRAKEEGKEMADARRLLLELFDEGQVDLQELAGVSQELPRSHRVHIILHLRPSAHPLRDDLAALQNESCC